MITAFHPAPPSPALNRLAQAKARLAATSEAVDRVMRTQDVVTEVTGGGHYTAWQRAADGRLCVAEAASRREAIEAVLAMVVARRIARLRS